MSNIVYDGRLVMSLENKRGPSAYDIAVQNGFEGTEAEWLESLKGPPGIPGDSVSVNNVRPVDGNINLYGTDIKVQRGSVVTVQQKLEELSETAGSYLTAEDIVNDTTTGGVDKVLSAEQGAKLYRRMMYGFASQIEIPLGNWNGDGPYTRDITLNGVTANEELCHVILSCAPANKTEYSDLEVTLMAQKDDAITVQVNAIPDAGFPANVLVLFTGVEEATV